MALRMLMYRCWYMELVPNWSLNHGEYWANISGEVKTPPKDKRWRCFFSLLLPSRKKLILKRTDRRKGMLPEGADKFRIYLCRWWTQWCVQSGWRDLNLGKEGWKSTFWVRWRTCKGRLCVRASSCCHENHGLQRKAEKFLLTWSCITLQRQCWRQRDPGVRKIITQEKHLPYMAEINYSHALDDDRGRTL